jgi:hypothetical protein
MEDETAMRAAWGSGGSVARGAFEAGEEVVFRIDGAEVFDVETGQMIPPSVVPTWTIGVIMEVTSDGSGRAYALSFLYCGDHCLCTVDESAIEGTA